MRFVPIDSTLRNDQPGSHREVRADHEDFFSGESSRVLPTYPQTSFSFDAHERRKAKTLQFYAVIAAMFRLWSKWLGEDDPLGEWAKALNKPPSYASKLSAALNRHEGRNLQVDHITPLLDCPEAEALWAQFSCDLCGCDPPVKRREVTKEEDDQATHEVLSELPEELQQIIRTRKAKKLGKRPEDVKL